MRLITLDLGSGGASVQTLSTLAAEFPVVPPALLGRRCRYAYAAVFDTESITPDFRGLAKLDLTAADPGHAVVGAIEYGPSRRGGEAAFVPRAGSSGEEDDGWLLSLVHDEVAGRSELAVFDAASMSSKPVARVALRRHVPHGFHCRWVSSDELVEIERRQEQEE